MNVNMNHYKALASYNCINLEISGYVAHSVAQV